MRTLKFLSILVAIIGCLETQGQVIIEPDDVTICEGGEAVFTCVLNSNIRSDDVQWYRFIKDTSTTVMVDPNGENINFLTHTNGSSSLTITNAMKSYTGYFWVGTPSLNVCNASLTVGTRPSALTVNIIKNIESLSIVVQWDAVDDFLFTTYTVTWTDERGLMNVATVDEQTSYTITRLTLDTVYTITVTAANRCGNGPEFSTSISLSTNTISTTPSTRLSPMVTASTTAMTSLSTASPSNVTMNITTTTTTTSATVMTPSTTTTTVNIHTSAMVTTTNIIRHMTTTTSVINFSTTTTVPAAATVSSSSFTGITTASSITTITTITTTTASTNVAMSSAPAMNFTNKADVSSGGSDSSAGYIVAGVVGGIIVVSVIFIMIYCFVLYRKKHGKADVDGGIKLNQYANFPRDNKKVPSVSNGMIIYDDEPFKLRSDTSQQDMSVTVTPYTVVDIGDHKSSNSTFQLSHLPNDKMEPPNPSTANGSLAPQKGETDTQQQHSVEYAVVDRRKKKSRKEGKQQNDDAHEVTDNGVQHISVPTVTVPSDDDHASDEAVKSKNHPSLHYAELEMLPPSTDRYTISDEPPIVYAQVV